MNAKIEHFEQYAKNRHIEFSENVDTIDSISYEHSNNFGLLDVIVKINKKFYIIGFIDMLDGGTLRICGQLIGSDWLDDVNVTVKNFYNVDTNDAIEYLQKTLRGLIWLQDSYIEYEIDWQDRQLEINHSL